MKIAAIDIGSNAARLLISEAIEGKDGKTYFRKINLVRVPLRLGFDVFQTKKISKGKAAMILQMIIAFKQLLLIYNISHVKACATSSLREAKNGKRIIKKIKRKTGLNIHIISGEREADIIYSSHIKNLKTKNMSYLFIDVGGGSTEIIFIDNGIKKYSRSFNIGTIRILKNIVEEETQIALRKEISKHIKTSNKIFAVGSGGNINKLCSINKTKEGVPMKLAELQKWYDKLSPLSIFDRIKTYGLRDDRADVIVPALEIFINIMSLCNIKEIIVPKFSLADGISKEVYEEMKEENVKNR